MSYGFKEIMRQIDDARKVQDMSRDPFGSHDGMDIDPRTAVVETCGYGYRKGNWIVKDAGCGFLFYRSIAHKTLTESQIKKLLEDGITGTINGFKKTGGGTFSAKVTLDKQEPSLGFSFDGVTSRKGSAKRKR